MNSARILYHIARADFLERVRRNSFYMVLAGAAWLAYETFRGHVILQVDNYRGVYNGAWVGAMMSMVTTTFLSLFGFYVVKNCVARDRMTGVGEVLAATRLSKPLYALGKFLSNFAVLALIVGVLILGALAMQLAHGEDLRFDPVRLLSPFLLVAVPGIAVVAAVAVLFECVGWAQGGAGNALYFFVWGGTLGACISTGHDDPLGLRVTMASMEKALGAELGAAAVQHHTFSLGIMPRTDLGTFHYTGLEWSGAVVAGRLGWLAWALALALLAAFFFDRFDPARRRLRETFLPEGAGFLAQTDDEGAAADASVRAVAAGHVALPRLDHAGRAPFLAVLRGELQLMVKGANVWWWLVQVGMLVASFIAPLEVSTQRLLVFLWIWPLVTWSALGAREAVHGTQQLVFSSAQPLARQLPATWLAGFLLAFASAAGAMLRLAIAGKFVALAGCVAGAAFIPSLALALGAWAGSPRLFEIAYLTIWYVGPLSQNGLLDFSGSCPEAVQSGSWPVWLALAAGLCVAATLGRRRRLQN